MRVRATEVGFFNGSLVYPGQEFDIPDTMRIGKWMQPVISDELAASDESLEPVVRTRKARSKQE